jgi:tetratricopeptide (TPR) repeat protein
MKTVRIAIFLFLGLNSLSGFGQLDAKLVTAIIQYDSFEFEKAIANFNVALADTDNLKPKNIAKGFYYRGLTYLAILREATLHANKDWLIRYYDGDIRAFRDFVQATLVPSPNKFVNKAKSQLAFLESSVLQTALTALSSAGLESSVEEKKRLLQKALEYSNEIAEYSMSYIALDVRGQSHLALTDSILSHRDFSRSVTMYTENPPPAPDPFIGYVYYRKGLIEYTGWHNLPVALLTIQEGLKMVGNEKTRLIEKEGREENVSSFDNVTQDLLTFELDLYLNIQPVPEIAFDKFEAVLRKNPNDYSILVAYASLMENRDIEKAIEIYEIALAANPLGFTAHFNLGALLVNKAVLLNNEASDYTDVEEYEQAMHRVIGFLERALPHLEKAHEIEPNDLQILDALLSVCSQLEEREKYESYKQRRSSMKNQ